jgi:hypothetical protein
MLGYALDLSNVGYALGLRDVGIRVRLRERTQHAKMRMQGCLLQSVPETCPLASLESVYFC